MKEKAIDQEPKWIFGTFWQTYIHQLSHFSTLLQIRISGELFIKNTDAQGPTIFKSEILMWEL
jgi:hypothetical protein